MKRVTTRHSWSQATRFLKVCKALRVMVSGLKFRLFGLMASLALLAGCASTAPQPSDFNPLLVEPYALDSGDALRITVFEQPSLSSTYTVDVEGMISMPLIGDVPARGLTADELDASVTQALREGFCATLTSALKWPPTVRFSCSAKLARPVSFLMSPG
jgi:protein involved in polysaccharide export with SLBB domain